MRCLGIFFLALWVAFGVGVAARYRSLKTKEPADWSQGVSHRLDVTSSEEGLKWLARHQEPDGRWSARCSGSCGCSPVCSGSASSTDDQELTALCALAYMGAGYTPQNRSAYVDPIDKKTRRLGETLRKATKWLIQAQGADGAVGSRDETFLARHSLGALALAQAYGSTNAVAYRSPAQRAIALLDGSQALLGGWGLTERACWRDPVVTARALLALREARGAGLEVATADLGSQPLDGRSLDDAPPALAPQATARDCSLGSWNGPRGRVYETARTLVALESTCRWPAALGGAR